MTDDIVPLIGTARITGSRDTYLNIVLLMEREMNNNLEQLLSGTLCVIVTQFENGRLTIEPRVRISNVFIDDEEVVIESNLGLFRNNRECVVDDDSRTITFPTKSNKFHFKTRSITVVNELNDETPYASKEEVIMWREAASTNMGESSEICSG